MGLDGAWIVVEVELLGAWALGNEAENTSPAGGAKLALCETALQPRFKIYYMSSESHNQLRYVIWEN